MDYTRLYELLNEIALNDNQVLKCIMALLWAILMVQLYFFVSDILTIIISVIRKLSEIKRKKE